MTQTASYRLNQIPVYLFAELERKMAALSARGVDIINLGIGDPDIPTPEKMVAALKEALDRPEFHRYPSYEGAEFFKEAISEWLKKAHGVSADPGSEILVLIGSKEGLAHLPHAILNPGDTAVVTDPCYPVHLQSLILAGARPVAVPLTEENGFLPDLAGVPKKTWNEAGMVTLNYPNNPTTAIATKRFFTELVGLAHKHGFVICHDSAYIDICLDGSRQPSLLSVDGAKEVAVEFFSLSKMFNACGWRLGFCAGNKDVIASLGKFKNATDSGQFTAMQWAATVGLAECTGELAKTLDIYRERKEILCSALEKTGLSYHKSNSTFYVWCRVPKGYDSRKYADFLLERSGIAVAPGIGFGKNGDGHIRFSLTAPTERIREAAGRLAKSA